MQIRGILGIGVLDSSKNGKRKERVLGIKDILVLGILQVKTLYFRWRKNSSNSQLLEFRYF